MKRFIIVFVLLCITLPEAIKGNPKIYIGWFNDENRSVAGRGCWSSEPYYLECYPDVGGSIEGYCALGEGWLWVCTGEMEINSLHFSSITDGYPVPDACGVETVVTNANIIEHIESYGSIAVRGSYAGYDISLDGCHKGWFWLLRVTKEQVGWWSIYMSYDPSHPARATLCDSAQTSKEVTILSNYYLTPVIPSEWDGEPAISNNSSTWGAIKSLYK
jgi:hypothetical protein